MNLNKLASAAVAALFLLTPVTAAHADAVPTAPTNVVATAGTLSINLTFDAPNAVTEGVTEFDPYISADKGKTWNKAYPLAFDPQADDASMGFNTSVSWYGKNVALKPLASYKVKIVAVNATGQSADSAILAVKLPAVAPIFGFGGVNADAKVKFSKGVNVSWSVSTNGGKAITGYTVKYRKHSADETGAWTTYKKVSAAITKLTLPYAKVKGFTDFDVAVDATNAIGTGSGEAEIKVDAKGNISVWV
jgi:hypothetical protein